MSRAQHVLTISAVMFDMMKEDLFSKDTQAFVENMASTMKERAQKLSREMTAQLIDELPKDIERGKKYRDNPVFMKTALERSCYLYAQFQAMEMGLR